MIIRLVNIFHSYFKLLYGTKTGEHFS